MGFHFSSLYAPEAPPSLPPSVFLKALAKKAAKRGYKAFRWSVFLTAWLIMAPLGTLWLSQALFQPLNVTFAQIRAVIWLLADYTLVRGPFVVKAALEALFSGSSEPLQRFFFLNSPLPVPGQTVWDSLHPTMYVVFTWLWNTVRTRIFTLTNTDRLKASKVVFEAQLVSASVILVAIAALGLRELILSHTPEDELRVYNERRAAREEREKRHRELVEQTTAAAEVALKMDEETRKEALEALRQAVEASKSLKLDVPQSEGQKSPTEILEEARQRIEQLTKEALKKREELQAAEQEEVIKALSSSSNRDEKEKKKPQVFPAQDACLKSLSMQSADSYDREWLQGIVADHDKLSSGRVASFVPLINVIYILGELKKMALEQKAGTTEGVEAGRVMLALLELDLDDAWFHVACVISSATPEEKLWAQLRLQGHDEPPARFNLDLSFAPPPPEPKPMTRLRTRSRELLLQHEQEEEDDVGTSLEGSEEESDSFSTTDDDESSSVPAPLPSRDDPFAGLVSQMHSSIGSSSRNHQPFHPTSLSRSPSFQYPSPVVPFTAPTSDFTFALDVSNDTSLAASMSTSQNVSPIKPTAAPNIPFTFSMDLKDAAKKKISPFLESSSKGTAASSEKDPKGNMDRREAAKEEISPAMESSSKDIESPENAKKDTKGKKKLEMFPKTLSEVSLKTVRAVGDAPVPEQDLLWYYINVDGNQEGTDLLSELMYDSHELKDLIHMCEWKTFVY